MAGYPHYLSVQTHGGRCCGIKSIWNFPYSPNDIVQALPKRKFNGTSDYYGNGVSKAFDFMTDARPAESAGDRLKAVVAFIKKKRPAGLIEVTLAYHQRLKWNKFVTDLGFKVVSTFRNSNTAGSEIHVYHLVYDEKGY